jgi:hypothetical protein
VNVASIIAASATGCVLVGYVIKALKAVYGWCKTLGEAMDQVNHRSAQLIPNGGSSMRDEVSAMRAEMQAEMAKQREMIAELQQRPRVGIRLRR